MEEYILRMLVFVFLWAASFSVVYFIGYALSYGWYSGDIKARLDEQDKFLSQLK